MSLNLKGGSWFARAALQDEVPGNKVLVSKLRAGQATFPNLWDI